MAAIVANRERNSDLLNLFLRLVLGMFLIYHGIEVFDPKKMDEYATWVPKLAGIAPATIAYIGKSLELITGILLILGLFTRITALLIIFIFLFISFQLGDGRILMEEQYPFLFALFGLMFLVEGGRKYSLDNIINSRKRDRRP